jgi:hypothetical protein
VRELAVPLTITLERAVTSVKCIAIDLDCEALVTPQKVGDRPSRASPGPPHQGNNSALDGRRTPVVNLRTRSVVNVAAAESGCPSDEF